MMRRMELVSCCWPGLSRLWLAGDARGLLEAVGFAAAVNAALWVSGLRAEPLSMAWLALIWVALGVVWSVSAWRAYRGLPGLYAESDGSADEGLFIQAQGEYLRGHWFEAERLTLELARRFPCDVEAQLLLAAVYRRMKRFEEAKRRLNDVARLDRGAKWELEVSQEQRLLDRLIEERDSGGAPASRQDPPDTIAQAA
jgi:hypothetical protein